ncbi:VWA domain-containing protein [Marinobacter caseinilyticus]|uniref:VWA domain-containing protein n=1 Tax=Marinobacter caseinilyticus TaxID=2692195 RepID=UPI00140D859E|nr:VWA domain-containing protein [Marinobacter caseinilyticus]
MADLHFLRPLWLLALLTLPLLPLVIRQARKGQNGWARIMPATLLNPLLSGGGTADKPVKSPLIILVLAIATLTFALAGPAWRQAPTPLQQQNDSLVIILDLSLSMLATDVEPDRLTLAKRKILDLLKERDGSFTGLVVYAGDAHVVTPLTDDRKTIEGLLGVLDPLIMPATGNRPDLAVALAKSLLDQGAPGQGRLLLISDDVPAKQEYTIRDLLQKSPYRLSTLAVGTVEGGPIPLPKQGFIRDNGEVVITKADPDGLARVAERTGGGSHVLTFDNRDLRALDLRARDRDDWQDSDRDLSVSRWQDDGYWALWLALPLLLLGWRRGALLAVMVLVLPLMPSPAMAFGWDDLWSRPDQRGEALIEQDPKAAIDRFSRPDWRGSAQYRAGDYKAAAAEFAAAQSLEAQYNQANALAKSGDLQAALERYDQVLGQQPDHEDARYNRDLVKQLLDQQQQQSQDGDDNQQQQNSQNQQQNQQNKSQEPGADGNPPEQPPSGGGESSNPGQQNPGSDGGQSQRSQAAQEPKEGQGQPSEQEASNQPRDATQRGSEQEGSPPEIEAPAALDEQPLSQGQEQWLRRIPDDPGGLLRRKFLQQYRDSDTQPSESDTPW